ncbi:alpha/beta-hydrolase [Xylogone sp. PMI_703]|nr:alpha/beta-hydrolase [Xylogone sp. PMI_703]
MGEASAISKLKTKALRKSGKSLIPSESAAPISPTAPIKYAKQAEKLSYVAPEDDPSLAGTAVKAEFITPQDAVVVTADGSRVPGVPVAEAHELNVLKARVEGQDDLAIEEEAAAAAARNGNGADASLRKTMPPTRTHPLFPPLPLYGPPSLFRNLQYLTFRASSFVLSLSFLGVVVLGAAFTGARDLSKEVLYRVTKGNPDKKRPFYAEERHRKKIRKEQEKKWRKRGSKRRPQARMDDHNEAGAGESQFIPTEGGPDPLVCDVGYYARRVGLDVEEFKVQTEDGFIINLWHVYNPKEYTPRPLSERGHRGPDINNDRQSQKLSKSGKAGKRRFPILMIHGLLQSAGAYCTNDDDSLAFYLCKSGYDVWLGNNRCGFEPEHAVLSSTDPRMWAWNIRQMGVMDLPALTSRVLSETGFEKLALVAHSQGTTQTFVALAKDQRPELGENITVFCALAPAAYAGPLIGKMYFKFMRIISPAFFRIIFGIHAFIPFMMTMHRLLPGKIYGAMGYRVFSFLFNWSDERWDRGLRDRMFQFAPVYVSAESMRWWLGRECFARQKCILATKEETLEEEREMEEHHSLMSGDAEYQDGSGSARASAELSAHDKERSHRRRHPKGSTAWYNTHVPPFALWICGSDDLVDGRKLLRRFEHGREPYVRVVHSKVIDEYEHLDVIWAMDAIEKVGKEIKEVVWKTVPSKVREFCVIPDGCEEVEEWIDDRVKEGEKERSWEPQTEEEEESESTSDSN